MEKLTSTIGNPVNFSCPKDVGQAGGCDCSGTVIDEVWADPPLKDQPPRTASGPSDWGDYAFLAQLIQWKEGGQSVRLGYYRRPAGQKHWRFGSQMSVTITATGMEPFLRSILAKKAWGGR